MSGSLTNTSYVLKKNLLHRFDQLYDIYMHPNVNRFLNFEVMPKEQFRVIFNELTNAGTLYTYEADDQVLATTIVIRQKRRVYHVATLTTLATHPDFQHQGIGIRFIKALIPVLQHEGIKRIDLHTEADNTAAICFYKKLGFVHEGTMKKLFKRADEDDYIDQYIMGLILGSDDSFC